MMFPPIWSLTRDSLLAYIGDPGMTSSDDRLRALNTYNAAALCWIKEGRIVFHHPRVKK